MNIANYLFKTFVYSVWFRLLLGPQQLHREDPSCSCLHLICPFLQRLIWLSWQKWRLGMLELTLQHSAEKLLCRPCPTALWYGCKSVKNSVSNICTTLSSFILSFTWKAQQVEGSHQAYYKYKCYGSCPFSSHLSSVNASVV